MMLETKQPNSRVTMNSFFIKLSKETKMHVFSLNFKQMEMVKLKASFNNQ
jgi:hypothetical protein